MGVVTGSPRVSVLMGVYNGLPYVREAIESVLEQTYRDFEFLVVDDASTDESAEVVSEYAEEDDRIRLLENEKNRGLTWSLNRALDSAGGEFVARQDADDRSEPTRFERQVAYLDDHPEVAVVGTGARLVDAADETLDRRVVLADPSLTDLQRKNHLIHGSVMGRTRAFEAVDGYDEFFEYSQDYDLWLRLAAEHELRNIPEPLYVLREHGESIYIDKAWESTLYSLFARRQSTEQFDLDTIETVREQGIAELYEHLTVPERADFHRTLAGIHVRYGQTTPGRDEAVRSLHYSKAQVGAYALYALSLLGRRQLLAIRWALRRVMNARLDLRNRV
jgi:glycosyltransferase involved in cell wall biosynthesis